MTPTSPNAIDTRGECFGPPRRKRRQSEGFPVVESQSLCIIHVHAVNGIGMHARQINYSSGMLITHILAAIFGSFIRISIIEWIETL